MGQRGNWNHFVDVFVWGFVLLKSHSRAMIMMQESENQTIYLQNLIFYLQMQAWPRCASCTEGWAGDTDREWALGSIWPTIISFKQQSYTQQKDTKCMFINNESSAASNVFIYMNLICEDPVCKYDTVKGGVLVLIVSEWCGNDNGSDHCLSRSAVCQHVEVLVWTNVHVALHLDTLNTV